jgi:DNA adenine methylase
VADSAIIVAHEPILRWAGSKKRSLRYLLEHTPAQFEQYIEPFAGSACLFFNLNPRRAVLGDTNPYLIEFYETARRHATRVFNEFAELRRTEKNYYRVREQYVWETSAIRRAAYFLFLNRNCFNGIFRVNKKGIFNVPFSASRVPLYPSKETFQDSMKALNVAKIESADFVDLCKRHVRKGDFVYLDPPYYVPKQRVFSEYVPHEFARADIERLTNLLELIDSRGAFFLMNYPDCPMMRKIALRWKRRRIQIRRTISSQVASRGYTTEILIFNFGRN